MTFPVRVLLVEDVPANQKLVLRMLEKLGYSADLASNGLEAIRFLQSGAYDVVLMDIQMPSMDGFSATRWIRANFKNQKGLVIIAMTANTDCGERQKCLQAGMNDYIPKPVQMSTLHELLVRWRTNHELTPAV